MQSKMEAKNERNKKSNTNESEPAARKIGRIAASECLHVGTRNRALFNDAICVLVRDLEETAHLSRRVAHRVLAKDGWSARASALRCGGGWK